MDGGIQIGYPIVTMDDDNAGSIPVLPSLTLDINDEDSHSDSDLISIAIEDTDDEDEMAGHDNDACTTNKKKTPQRSYSPIDDDENTVVYTLHDRNVTDVVPKAEALDLEKLNSELEKISQLEAEHFEMEEFSQAVVLPLHDNLSDTTMATENVNINDIKQENPLNIEDELRQAVNNHDCDSDDDLSFVLMDHSYLSHEQVTDIKNNKKSWRMSNNSYLDSGRVSPIPMDDVEMKSVSNENITALQPPSEMCDDITHPPENSQINDSQLSTSSDLLDLKRWLGFIEQKINKDVDEHEMELQIKFIKDMAGFLITSQTEETAGFLQKIDDRIAVIREKIKLTTTNESNVVAANKENSVESEVNVKIETNLQISQELVMTDVVNKEANVAEVNTQDGTAINDTNFDMFSDLPIEMNTSQVSGKTLNDTFGNDTFPENVSEPMEFNLNLTAGYTTANDDSTEPSATENTNKESNTADIDPNDGALIILRLHTGTPSKTTEQTDVDNNLSPMLCDSQIKGETAVNNTESTENDLDGIEPTPTPNPNPTSLPPTTPPPTINVDGVVAECSDHVAANEGVVTDGKGTENENGQTLDEISDLEAFAKMIMDTAANMSKEYRTAEDKNETDNHNKIKDFVEKIRIDFVNLTTKLNLAPSSSLLLSKPATQDSSAQTDDKLLIENVKNLNEKLKKRHLESSTSDSTGESDHLDDERPRRRRLKKRRMKSLSGGEERLELRADDDKTNNDVEMSTIVARRSLSSEIVNGSALVETVMSNDDDDYNLGDYIIQKSSNVEPQAEEIKKNDDIELGNEKIADAEAADSDDQSPEFSDIEPEQPIKPTDVAPPLPEETEEQKRTTIAELEENLLEKEIDRLTNFTGLAAKRTTVENQKGVQAIIRKVRKPDGLIDIINEADGVPQNDHDNVETSSDSDCTMSEDKFLRQKNLEIKLRLLSTSDSDVSSNFDESDLEIKSSESESDENGESSNDSQAIDKFLDSMNKRVMENGIADDDHVAMEANKNKESVNEEKRSDGEEEAHGDKTKRDENLLKECTQTDMYLNEALDIYESNIEKPAATNDSEVVGDIDDAIDNFLKGESAMQEELLTQVIESGGIDDAVVDKDIGAGVGGDKSKSNTEKQPTTNHKDNVQVTTNTEDIAENVDSIDKPSASTSTAITRKTHKLRDPLEKEIYAKHFLDDNSSSDESKASTDTRKSKSKVTEPKPSAAYQNDVDSDVEILDVSMFANAKKRDKQVDIATLLTTAKKTRTIASKKDDDCICLSSESEDDLEEVAPDEEEVEEKGKKPRAILSDDQLTDETKQAQKEEAERVKRLEKKTEMLTQRLSQSQSLTQSTIEDSEIVLDYDSKRKTNICVHPKIVEHLKPHQIEGVKFVYDSCYGSVDQIEKFPGSGCILAHCMGLGKTLQLIAVLHTLIRYPQLKTHRILVVCPKSTVMNWSEEIQRWLGPIKNGPKLKIFHFPDNSDIHDKVRILADWHKCGTPGQNKSGCLLAGYEAFRGLVGYHKKKNITLMPDQIETVKKKVDETLLNPGADIIICDEGHIIKNSKSAISMAVSRVKTKRRIILTGTPIQNNLKEYYCMVNFIKPFFLGTEKEFANLYANPIKNGQHKDSSKTDIKFMKQRSFVLHKKLSKFVQRREAAILKTFLPEKYEYVLFIPMTDVQERLYEHFLANNPLKDKYSGKSLIPDYTCLRKIWTHPKVLENAWQNAIHQKEKERQKLRKQMLEDLPDEDDQPDDELDNRVGKMSVTDDWWRHLLMPDDLTSLIPSNKLRVLFEILRLCEANKEKCLVFSAFCAVLNVVEYFMKIIHEQNEANLMKYGVGQFRGPWLVGYDYYRLDGRTGKSVRHAMITKFNDPANDRTRCFLISAKAGGQGINLCAANRVIILDTSWNPSNDQQNIFRVFRLGQKKECFIYRLLAMGTMEEKVYSRSVTKQAMSFRVVDEQQIDRHYSMAELAELYTLTKTDYTARPVPIRPFDGILSNLLLKSPDLVYKYHEHDSLLENKPEQDLSEADKAEAWSAYENDLKVARNNGLLDQTGLGADFPNNLNANYRGMSASTAAGLYGAYNNFARGYSNLLGSGLFNSPPYGGSNLNPASLLPSYLGNSYQQTLANITNDPNLMRMRQMYAASGSPYANPYGAMSPPTGQTSPFSSGSSYGSSGLSSSLSSGLNNSGYYKSITPPATIRPMSGGFASLSEMANYLAVPTSTPPPPAHISSIPTSSNAGGSAAAAALAGLSLPPSTLWKNYFARDPQPALGPPFPTKTTPPSSSSIMSSSPSSLNSSVVSTQSNSPLSITKTTPSTTSFAASLQSDRQPTINNISNANQYSALAKELGLKAIPVTSPGSATATPMSIKPVSQPPSIPTSVITKPASSKPNPLPKSSPKLPSNSVVIQTPMPRKSPATTTANIHSSGRYSPPPHVIVRNNKLPSTTSTSVLTTAATPTQSPSTVKNINMGIIYPVNNKEKSSVITHETLSSYLANTKSSVTVVNNNSATSGSSSVVTNLFNAKKAVPKPANVAMASANLRKGTQITPVTQLQSKTVNTVGQTRIIAQSSNTTGTKPNTIASSAIQSGNKSRDKYDINISELSKTNSLSITAIPAKSSATGSNASPAQRLVNKPVIIKPPANAIIKTTGAGTQMYAKQMPMSKTVPPIRLTQVLTSPKISSIPSSSSLSALPTTNGSTIRRMSNTGSSAQTVTSMNPPQLTAVPTSSLLQNKRSSSTSSLDRAGSQPGTTSAIRAIPTRQLSQSTITTTPGAAVVAPQNTKLSLAQQKATSNQQKSMPPLIFAAAKSKGSPTSNQQTPAPSPTATRRIVMSNSQPKMTTATSSNSQSTVRTVPIIDITKGRKGLPVLSDNMASLNSLSQPSTSSHIQTLQEYKKNQQNVAAGTKRLAAQDNAMKRVKSFDAISIAPRNSQPNSQLLKTNKKNSSNVVDIVELD